MREKSALSDTYRNRTEARRRFGRSETFRCRKCSAMIGPTVGGGHHRFVAAEAVDRLEVVLHGEDARKHQQTLKVRKPSIKTSIHVSIRMFHLVWFVLACS